MEKIYRLQFWGFLLFCTYLSLTPSLPNSLQSYSDKVLHVSGYMALYLSCLLAYRYKYPVKFIFSTLLGFSVLIEIIQQFIPHRGFDLLDILANAFGLALGTGLGAMLGKVAKKTDLSQS